MRPCDNLHLLPGKHDRESFSIPVFRQARREIGTCLTMARALTFPMTLFSSSLIDSDISRAWTLPANCYIDPELAREERDRIFARTWQVVGHHRQVAQPGDYFTTQLVGEPLLIVRGSDQKLRAFFNVCRHRAGPPAEGCGSRKLFRCVYHGWTYNLDGSLNHATEVDGVQGFRAEDFALAPVRCEEWFNLILVNLDAHAAPLRNTLAELVPQAERFPFATMKLFERRTYEMKCNWKTYVDNYLEGYHLPTVHPGLNRELDFNAYTVEPHAQHVRQRLAPERVVLEALGRDHGVEARGRQGQQVAGACDVDAGAGLQVDTGVVARLELVAHRTVDVERADFEHARALEVAAVVGA